MCTFAFEAIVVSDMFILEGLVLSLHHSIPLSQFIALQTMHEARRQLKPQSSGTCTTLGHRSLFQALSLQFAINLHEHLEQQILEQAILRLDLLKVAIPIEMLQVALDIAFE